MVKGDVIILIFMVLFAFLSVVVLGYLWYMLPTYYTLAVLVVFIVLFRMVIVDLEV